MALTKPIVVPVWGETAGGTDLQKPADGFIQGGWPNSGTPPSRQFFNWLLNFATNGVRYLTRRGLPDWGSDETYVAGDVVRDSAGPSSGAIYSLTGTATLGLAPHLDTANWELIFPKANPIFGDGSDGDLTVSATTTFDSVDKQYNNLTIGPFGNLEFHRGILRVKGTLTINNGGVIHANGADASGATGGVGKSGRTNSGSHGPVGVRASIGHGGYGANSVANTAGATPLGFSLYSPAAVNNSLLDYTGYSALGGAGGLGNSSGGAAASPPAVQQVNALISAINQMHTPGFLRLVLDEANEGSDDEGTWGALQPIYGGIGGSSGGGSASDPGGGGGAGGGVLCIFANKIILGSTTCLRARGGAGGFPPAGSGVRGGGGGGGGGRIIVLHAGASGSTLDASNTVNGGPGTTGSGGGGSGGGGSQGTILFAQIL